MIWYHFYSFDLPNSQLVPKYMSGHSHLYSSPSVMHVPPFLQGLLAQAEDTKHKELITHSYMRPRLIEVSS